MPQLKKEIYLPAGLVVAVAVLFLGYHQMTTGQIDAVASGNGKTAERVTALRTQQATLTARIDSLEAIELDHIGRLEQQILRAEKRNEERDRVNSQIQRELTAELSQLKATLDRMVIYFDFIQKKIIPEQTP